MKFTLASDSRIGSRQMNQDRFEQVLTPQSMLLVVADGMGGHRHGEVAAQIAAQHIAHAFRQDAGLKLDQPARFLLRAFVGAHRAINDYAALRAIGLEDAPRTTCVACVIQDGQATWAHTGDSRLYLLRKGRILARTYDHSRVQSLIDAGEITEAEALVHPQRNLVFSCLGGDLVPRIDVAPDTQLDNGDVVALCTDGAWAPVAARLPMILMLPPDSAVPTLLDAAQASAGQSCDNLTLIVLRWESAAADMRRDRSTQPLSAISTLVYPFASGDAAGDAGQLSDADIERAIEDIRQRIVHKKPSGASR